MTGNGDEHMGDGLRRMLEGFGLAIGAPAWLLLLVLIVPIVALSRKSLAGLGVTRRALAILARVAVLALITLALAELRTTRVNDALTTLFVIDDSESIPSNYRSAILDVVNRSQERQRRPEDLSGVIVFGKNARVETPPSLNPRRLQGLENPPDPQYTDIAAGLKLALAVFPKDTARRIVLISDGNANRGSVLEQAAAAKRQGIPIDTLVVDYKYDDDVLVEKINVPAEAKQGETISLDVVIRASQPATGRLQLIEEADNTPVPVFGEEPQPITLERGINVFKIRKRIDRPNFYQYRAQFIPDDPDRDRRASNNEAVAFTAARGNARVLLIESNAGDHADLVEALERNGIEMDVRVISSDVQDDSGALPTELAQLQPFDAVILADVPKDAFTDRQIEMLAANTFNLGGGLIMLGGPNSFGAGRWMGTAVEKALPVDMQIRSEKFAGKTAVAMIMHASEIAQGNYWQAQIAKAAISTLSNYDYAGVLFWTGRDQWLFPLITVGPNRNRMLALIDQMIPGDMPAFGPGMTVASNSLLQKTDAITKHMIIISDGDPAPPPPGLINQLVRGKITVTTVLTAAHGNDPGSFNTMQSIAQATKGRFYNVTNPRALPRIYQKEIRLISRPLIHEEVNPWNLALRAPSEPMAGISEVPGVRGLVLTEIKRNPLVEMPIASNRPVGREEPWPVLAHWNHGLGRAVAFTSDAGKKWTSTWTSWESYQAFWTQLVRWSLRPLDSGSVRMTLRRDGGSIKIVAEATDSNQEFLNNLRIDGRVVRPDNSSVTLSLRQTAPGRYEAELPDAEARGNYFVTLNYSDGTGETRGLVTSGVSVPYSDEYRDLRSNPTTLETLSQLTGGQSVGFVTRPNGLIDLDATLARLDPFRRDPTLQPARSESDLWPDLLFAAAFLFLVDIGVRRIALDFDQAGRFLRDQLSKLRGQDTGPAPDYLEKLKSRKAEVSEQLAAKAGEATRLEPPAKMAATGRPPLSPPSGKGGSSPFEGEPPGGSPVPATPKPPPRPAPSSQPASKTPTDAGEESYTDRLLKAKRKVWDQRDADPPPNDR